MSRPVVDKVFEEANEKAGAITIDQNFYYMYGGTVQVGFPKIKIEQIHETSTAHGLLYGIRRNYDAMRLLDEPAIIAVGDNYCTTFPEIIKCLKALFIGQCNKNEDYSKAVAFCATQLLQMVLREEAALPLIPPTDYTEFQIMVVSEVSGFIKECFIKDGIGWIDSSQLQALEVSEVTIENADTENQNTEEYYEEDDIVF